MFTRIKKVKLANLVQRTLAYLIRNRLHMNDNHLIQTQAASPRKDSHNTYTAIGLVVSHEYIRTHGGISGRVAKH